MPCNAMAHINKYFFITWCHEYCRKAADVVIKSAGVGWFLCKRACWNQNAELHMPTFWPCDGAALIISRWFINTSSVLLSFFDLETVRASYYESPLGACSFMQHPCNAKQSGKSQTFMWQFSHTHCTDSAAWLSLLSPADHYSVHFFFGLFFLCLFLTNSSSSRGPRCDASPAFKLVCIIFFFPFLIY